MATTEDLREGLAKTLRFYKALGFDRLPLCLENAGQAATFSGELPSAASDDRPDHTTPEKDAALAALREEIGDCGRCRLSEGRKNIVFGDGSPDTRIMFIGEGPGAEEDKQGKPFVGDAGQVLTSLITNMGKEKGFSFTREDVYIANIVKCRPPANRDPQPDEIETCLPFLKRQIEIIRPEVIISLGKISAHTLLGIGGPISGFSITRTRGRFYEFESAGRTIPLMPTFHPAYFLRNPGEKKKTWEDARAVLKKLEETGGER